MAALLFFPTKFVDSSKKGRACRQSLTAQIRLAFAPSVPSAPAHAFEGKLHGGLGLLVLFLALGRHAACLVVVYNRSGGYGANPHECSCPAGFMLH